MRHILIGTMMIALSLLATFAVASVLEQRARTATVAPYAPPTPPALSVHILGRQRNQWDQTNLATFVRGRKP